MSSGSRPRAIVARVVTSVAVSVALLVSQSGLAQGVVGSTSHAQLASTKTKYVIYDGGGGSGTPSPRPWPDYEEFVPRNPCQLAANFDGTLNVGFPRHPERLPVTGVIRAIIIPISPLESPGSGDPYRIFRPMAEGVDGFYNRMSQGNLRFEFSVVNQWVPITTPLKRFGLGTWAGGDANGFYETAVKAADPLVDYARFDVVYFMVPKNISKRLISYGPAIPGGVDTQDGTLNNGTFSGASTYMALDGALWKWAVHETGHLFGMTDLYTTGKPTFGYWDVMAQPWTTKAVELNAWNRFTQGWLTDDQLTCVTLDELATRPVIASLISMSSVSPGIKAVMVKLSDKKILVIESRRSGGLDRIAAKSQGLLVYTVDVTIESQQGGFKTQRRVGSRSSDFSDALLKSGDKVVVSGVQVSVVRAGTESTVRVNKI